MSERLGTDPENIVTCRACGRDNPAAHKFCGSCGADLNVEDSHPSSESGGESGLHHGDSDATPRSTRAPQTFEHSITNPQELSLFRSFRPAESESEDDWYDDGPNYRLYIGIFLAIVLMGLGYLAWRSSKLQSARQTPAAPPAATQEPAPTSSPPTNNAAKPPQTKAAQAAPAPAQPKAQAPATQTEPKHEQQRESAGKNGPAEPAPTAVAAGNGSEELAVAQRYLNGGNGQHRDTAEAAKWLWKSIAKHNSEATVLLADLYLRGDGVSKNCDQARVLLDSAARKGSSLAGERLRNLQAFGCQ